MLYIVLDAWIDFYDSIDNDSYLSFEKKINSLQHYYYYYYYYYRIIIFLFKNLIIQHLLMVRTEYHILIYVCVGTVGTSI